MKLEGSADFPYGAAEVWEALHDIDMLTRTIPGCTSMAPSGEDTYRIELSLGVASIKGDYEGVIRVTDLDFPRHYLLHGEGEGKPGYVNVKVTCHLEPTDDGTTLRWASEAEVGGLIAGIGGRVLTGVSKHMARQFFKTLSAEMAAARPGPETGATPEETP